MSSIAKRTPSNEVKRLLRSGDSCWTHGVKQRPALGANPPRCELAALPSWLVVHCHLVVVCIVASAVFVSDMKCLGKIWGGGQQMAVRL